MGGLGCAGTDAAVGGGASFGAGEGPSDISARLSQNISRVKATFGRLGGQRNGTGNKSPFRDCAESSRGMV